MSENQKKGKIRSILHVDLNNFYASVACHDNPSLKGEAVAVAGSKEERHGIILAKNELAEKMGVQTAEPIWQAKLKCPKLIIVPPDFERYMYFSKKANEIYERYTDMIEPFGIDESWLDVTGSYRIFGSGMEIAEQIRKAVKEELGLTVSIGVSFNKVFAKLGSDLKKPDAISEIPYDKFKEIVWPLEVGCLLGVGKSTEASLRRLAIMTVGELATYPSEKLSLLLGKNGETLQKYARGEDNSPVSMADFVYVPKSIGRSTTTPKDITNYTEAKRVLLKLSEEIAYEIRSKNLEGYGVALNIRTHDLATGEVSRKLNSPLQTADGICEQAVKLMKGYWDGKTPLRSIGVRVDRLCDYSPTYQFNLFEDRTKEFRHEKIERSVDAVRDRFGKTSLVRASLLNEKEDKERQPYKPFRPMNK